MEWNTRDIPNMKKIADRAAGPFPSYRRDLLIMDLDAVDSNDMKLDFERLLNFSDFDFGHDISGIHNHIDRETGKLRDGFAPKCAVRPNK